MINQKTVILITSLFLINTFLSIAQYKTELEKIQDSIIQIQNERNKAQMSGRQHQDTIIARQKENIQLKNLQLSYSNQIIDLNNTQLNLHLDLLKEDMDTIQLYQELVNKYYDNLIELKKIEIEKGAYMLKHLEEAINRKNTEQLISKKEEFKLFISKFNNDPIFQMESIGFPLEIITLKNPTEENNFDTIKMTIKEYYRISFTPLNSNIVDGEIKLSNRYPSSDTAVIIVEQEDTGVHIEYYFSRQKGLWLMLKVKDLST